MQKIFVLLPLLLAAAACAGKQPEARPAAGDAQAKVAPVQYRSAFEGYRGFAEEELVDWRKSNEEVGAAGGHAGHRPGQGRSEQGSKPQPSKPESSGGGAEHGGLHR